MRFTKIANQIANEKWQSAQIFKGAFEPRLDFDEERINQINELIIVFDIIQIYLRNKNMARTIKIGDKVRSFLTPVKGVVTNIIEKDMPPGNYYSVGTSTKVFVYG